MKRPAFIVDFDGTLYDCEARRARNFTAEKKNFDAFNAEAIDDPPHAWCAELVQALRIKGYFPIFFSGRENIHRIDAERWLRKHLNVSASDYLLWMRPTGDYRKDAEIKLEAYHAFVKHDFNVLLAIDDRKQVVDMWRALGLTCLQCADGEF